MFFAQTMKLGFREIFFRSLNKTQFLKRTRRCVICRCSSSCRFFQVFDRDEPAREKEVYVTVRATDNGKPQLDDVCTMKITIEDVNDNPPVFDKAVSISSWFVYLDLCSQHVVGT